MDIFKENGKMIKYKENVKYFINQEIFIKDLLKKIKKMAKEFLFSKMELFTKENSKMIYFQEKEK